MEIVERDLKSPSKELFLLKTLGSQIGKDHDVDIVVRGQKVRSIMPVEGIFTRVVEGGEIQGGDTIEVITEDD